MAFGKNKKNMKDSGKAILPHGAVTILSADTVVEGALKLGGDLRIDGVVKGGVEGKKRVVIGEKGSVIGDVCCDFLELHGRIEGNVKSEQGARLHSTATLKGDLHTPQFSVDMGAKFVGSSTGQQEVASEEQPDGKAKKK